MRYTTLRLLLAFAFATTAYAEPPPNGRFENQPQHEAQAKQEGCRSCHTDTDSPTMHTTGTVQLGCVDCHGGAVDVRRDAAIEPGSDAYVALTAAAHVARPTKPALWPSSANPERLYAAWNRENEEWIRFVNPGDLRVAARACGATGCHPSEVARVQSSMMTHGAMLWGAALYNNGATPSKTPRYGESYAPDGTWQRLQSVPPPTPAQIRKLGILPFLEPLPRFEITQPGNVLRVFERGDNRLSPRGLGTLNRTDPVFQGLQRTRLLDPILSFPGTNDHPGDYRQSGCTACHVPYANDRDPFHSGAFSSAGNRGTTQTVDPTIPRDEPGHPIKHAFTRGVPSSQCVVCHMHPGTAYANTYFGYMWWDNETHGEHMYPRAEQHPTPEAQWQSLAKNPEGSSVRGLWSDLYPDAQSHAGETAGPDFLARVSQLNPKLHLTKFADFHGHGWVFRAVFKHDRKGRLLDAIGNVVEHVTPQNTQQAIETPVDGRPHGGAGIPVHLKDIHLEKGMQCVDCHFEQDVHGNGRLYGEVRNAVEIECVDCHGSAKGRATLRTSGPAAPEGGSDLSIKVTPFGAPLFQWENGRLYQQSMTTRDTRWEVVQVLDSITPGAPHYNERARLAKTIRRDGTTWGDVPASAPDVRAGGADPPRWGDDVPRPTGAAAATLAHRDDAMACYTCHTAWMTSCFGCHLPMRANARQPLLHGEGDVERNWTMYNYQVLRDDVFMLGHDGSVKRHRIAPVRSSSAVIVGSQNVNREWIYSQQQTISTDGYSGQAFNPHFPHAVRTVETKTCTDCHVARDGDNNAWMAQLLTQGTGFVNFLGRYVWVAEEEHGLEAVAVTEQDEPQAVIGSTLHALAYPDAFATHLARDRVLQSSAMYEHPGNDILALPGRPDTVQSLQLRGEYLYSANGPGGLRVYDVANIDNKKEPERITTSVISPLGQRLAVPTRDAAAVLSPATIAVDPTRARSPENEERDPSLVYGFLYVLDRVEGLVIVPAATLLDGNPDNNFLDRLHFGDGTDAFNPDGALTGASNGWIAGDHLYACTPHGLVVVSIADPTAPRVVAQIGPPALDAPRAVTVQFRYAFVIDAQGLKVVDVTEPAAPRAIPGAAVPLDDARDLYVARTYAYVAAGHEGLAIVDVEHPEHPRLDQRYTAGGVIDDTRGVKIGMTNASLFAYLADGRNGLRVVQLMSPETPGATGFSPRPRPDLPGLGLIATYPTHGPAVAVSRGLDRDRAADESGHQLAVFGRRGAGPLTSPEQRALYVRDGRVWTVPTIGPGTDLRRAFGPPR